ncbi:CHAP domain-containing protein [Saccharomonospora saliphila]|uniref:CHAP domain-containing protein n=1 Tax=Saccharomonospora saliphila TaxID=369829 RepID=UPI0006628B0F|nr:CHAP domain-containing protein [Saccharomonospora saliphila]
MARLTRQLSTLLALLVASTALAVVESTPAAAEPTHGPYPAKFAIDGRASMDPDDRVATDAYLTGDDVHVVCQDSGLPAGGSTLWIYTDDGYWVPDAYVTTGTDGYLTGVPRCLSLGINGTPSSGGADSGPYPVKFAVDGRGSADPDDRVRTDAYPDGSSLYVHCQDYGISAGGSTLWIYTTDGYWVPDAYVTTGTDDRLPGVPLCSSLGIDGGTGANPGGGAQFKTRVTLNGYHAKSLSADNVWDAYPEGSYLTLMCQAYGEVNYGGSALWGLTSDGLWVPDYYVITGSNGLVLNRCDDDPASGGGNRFLAKATLNGYHAKSLDADNVWDMYPAGSYLTIECQAYGEFNYGGYAVWDYTSDGVWVPDYYVSTGSWDIVLPRCDDDPKPSGGPGNPTVPTTPTPGSVEGSEKRAAIVNAAYGQLGTHEWGDNCNPYGYQGEVVCGAPWCSMFASWAWQQAGIDVYFPYTGSFETWGRNHGLLTSKDAIRPGDVVLYGTDYYNSHHIGVVVEVLPDGDIVTVEGNYGNQVKKVGPFDPHDPDAGATGHSYSNIYAVVSPTADPTTSTDWDTVSYLSEDWDGDGMEYGEALCTDQYNDSGIFYRGCLEYRAGRVVPHLTADSVGHDAVVRAKLTMIDATGDLSIAVCEAALLSDNRSCRGPSGSTDGAAARLRVDVEVNGTWQPTLWVGQMYANDQRQEEDTWCGVAATRAILSSMHHTPLGSQSDYADKLGTSSIYGSMPWDVRDVLNEELGSGATDYVYHDYADEGSTSEKWSLVKNRLSTSVDLDQPAGAVVQVADIPWWSSSPGALEMHFLVVHGYAGVESGDGISVDNVMVWDPAHDENYLADSRELYDMTRSDNLPGQGHMIVVAQ